MSLTYRSSISEMVQIVVRDADGSRRVARLERDPSNPRKWSGSVDHPGGQSWSVDTFDPDAVAALGKLADAFVSREVDFRAAKGRNYKPPARIPDVNRQLPDTGEFAPIVRNDRDNRR